MDIVSVNIHQALHPNFMNFIICVFVFRKVFKNQCIYMYICFVFIEKNLGGNVLMRMLTMVVSILW